MGGEIAPAEALQRAVWANDAAAVAGVLERHPDLGARLDEPLPDAEFGSTALLAAVSRNNREMVDVLLKAGADINARSHWWAGSFGVLDHDGSLSDYLIERGATVDAHAAARLGMVERLAELIAVDPALVHARGGDGQTPLHFARSKEVAEYLMAHGADIDARDVDHESTPAQWMIQDRREVARYLVSRGCATDILLASAVGDVDLVRTYLDDDPSAIRTTVSHEFFPKKNPRSAGTIYNWTLGTGKTAHIVARDFRHDEVLRLLMDRTPAGLRLAVACEIGDDTLVKSVLASAPGLAGALTPAELRKLPDAARDENRKGVQLMLHAGWPIDARGQHGATALHWASFHGNVDIARELLPHNPPLELKDHDFKGTPLFWAVYGSVHGWRCKTGDYVGTVRVLLDAGAEPPPLTDDLAASDAVRQLLLRS